MGLRQTTQPRMEVSYAIRTCNEVCKDQTAAITYQSYVPLLETKRGVGIQESVVSARDHTLGGLLWLMMV
jgi:hypothetical protein